MSESGAAHGRLSDRPGSESPAFQSCLPQEVMKYAPDTEGGLAFRDHRIKAALDEIQRLALHEKDRQPRTAVSFSFGYNTGSGIDKGIYRRSRSHARKAVRTSRITLSQSPWVCWRKRRILGYQGESLRPMSQRQSGAKGMSVHTIF